MFMVYKRANGLINSQSEGTSGGFFHLPMGLPSGPCWKETGACFLPPHPLFLRRAAHLTSLAQQG